MGEMIAGQQAACKAVDGAGESAQTVTEMRGGDAWWAIPRSLGRRGQRHGSGACWRSLPNPSKSRDCSPAGRGLPTMAYTSPNAPDGGRRSRHRDCSRYWMASGAYAHVTGLRGDAVAPADPRHEQDHRDESPRRALAHLARNQADVPRRRACCPGGATGKEHGLDGHSAWPRATGGRPAHAPGFWTSRPVPNCSTATRERRGRLQPDETGTAQPHLAHLLDRQRALGADVEAQGGGAHGRKYKPAPLRRLIDQSRQRNVRPTRPGARGQRSWQRGCDAGHGRDRPALPLQAPANGRRQAPDRAALAAKRVAGCAPRALTLGSRTPLGAAEPRARRGASSEPWQQVQPGRPNEPREGTQLELRVPGGFAQGQTLGICRSGHQRGLLD